MGLNLPPNPNWDVTHIDCHTLVNANCFDIFPFIENKSINMILCDLPYGKTKNKWDSMLELNELWRQYERIIVDNGVIVLFGQDKFSAKLMLSNEKLHRYNIIWEKTTPTGYLNAKKMPLRNHEDILVFYKQLPTYNPQKTIGHERKISSAHHKRNSKKTTNYGEHGLISYDSTERYPKSIWKFATDKQKESLHPTQKPILLLEEIIKTFTNEGDTVLDNTMGSGTTILAAIKNNRIGIGIEKEKVYFDITVKRIKSCRI
jgi:site-specific DNA-methyltransferase (adenine-specific)